jgi:hypothetical protein
LLRITHSAFGYLAAAFTMLAFCDALQAKRLKRIKNMRIKCAALTGLLVPIFFLACAGTRPTFEAFKMNTEAEQKVIIQTVEDDPADYDIYQCRYLSVIDPKNDDRTLIMPEFYCKPFVPQTKDDFVRIYEVIGIRSLVGPAGQLFGYISWGYEQTVVRAEMVDAKTMRITQHDKPFGAPGRR